MLLAGSKPTGSWAMGVLLPEYVGVPGSTPGGIPGSNAESALSGELPLATAALTDGPFTSRPFSSELALEVGTSNGAPSSLRQPLSAPSVAAKTERTR